MVLVGSSVPVRSDAHARSLLDVCYSVADESMVGPFDGTIGTTTLFDPVRQFAHSITDKTKRMIMIAPHPLRR